MKMMRLNSERWKRKELSCSGGVFIYLMSEKKYCKTNYVLVIMPYKYQFFFVKKKKKTGRKKREKQDIRASTIHHQSCYMYSASLSFLYTPNHQKLYLIRCFMLSGSYYAGTGGKY